MQDRRAVLALIGAGLTLAPEARLAAAGLLPDRTPRLAADDGSPMRAVEVSRERAAPALTGAQRLGAETADVLLVEWFDYNCGFCRHANAPLEQIIAKDPGFALLLVHSPILSPGSADAAAVQRAVFLRDGAARAADLHRALLAAQGRVDGARARAICAKLQIGEISSSEFDAAVADVEAMRKGAAALGFKYTPTFWMAGTAFVGWPGPTTIEALVAEARRCGRLQCG